jgi:hypothetical protein
MVNSYSRRCRTCDRWISMRQMPHGKWVAFEHNEPHECGRPPRVEPVRPAPRKPAPIAGPTEFPDFELPNDEISRPGPTPPVPPRPQPAPPTQPKVSRPAPPARPPAACPQPAPPAETTPPVARASLRPQPPTAPAPEPPPALTSSHSSGLISGSLRAIFTVYVAIGAFHSIAFSLFVSRVTCATTTKALISIFCNSGMGIAHLVAVLGWPWYWF